MSQPQPATRITRLGTVGIPVADPGRALSFYLGTLGFEKRLDVPYGDGARWIEVAPPGGQATLALITPGSGQHPGIRLATQRVDADHARLLASGVDTDPGITRAGHPVPPMFSVRDPDGNTLLIVQEP